MFSCLITSLNSLEDELVSQIRARLLSFLSLFGEFSVSREFQTLAVAGAIVISTVVIGSVLRWSLYSKKKRKVDANCGDHAELIADLPEFDLNLLNFNARFHEGKGDHILQSDVKNAEDLQIQEVLFASLQTSRKESIASSSGIQVTQTLNPKLPNTAEEVNPPQSFCKICMDNRNPWHMFINTTCSHSFCYDCTSRHIITKIQDTVNIVTCPELNCNAPLDFGACRWMIPEDIAIRWDESLSRSLIQESQKVYCPFRDCLAMLVNDSGTVVRETQCPLCQRMFCAWCQVPWHSEFTCDEFSKLNGKKERGDDLLVEKLARKKNWRKCPNCKFYVEKTEGCLHITCRCNYEFCYRCGSKWRSSEHVCRAKGGR